VGGGQLVVGQIVVGGGGGQVVGMLGQLEQLGQLEELGLEDDDRPVVGGEQLVTGGGQIV